MDSTQRNALIDSLEVAVATTGVDLYAGSQRLKQWIDRKYRFFEAAQSRESLDRYFAGIEESEEMVSELILMSQALPKLLEEFIQATVVRATRQIPVPSGRPPVLTPEMQRKIVAKMLGLIGQKVKTGIAQARCAQEFGVSKRTVQAVWRERDEIAEQPFRSMEDVWRFFSH